MVILLDLTHGEGPVGEIWSGPHGLFQVLERPRQQEPVGGLVREKSTQKGIGPITRQLTRGTQ